MNKDTLLVSAEDRAAIQTALQVLKGGGLVVFPTDTVYGLGAAIHDPQAIAELYRVKGRMQEKAIPVLVADISQTTGVARSLPPNASRLAAKFWPGPLTLIVWRRPDLPLEVSSDLTVGIRMPNQDTALALLNAAGPLAVTSANKSGQPSACTVDEVQAMLGGEIDLILDGGKCPGGIPSTVVDCTHAVPRILRRGPIPVEEIMNTLE